MCTLMILKYGPYRLLSSSILRFGSYSNWVFFRTIPFRLNDIHQCILIKDVVKRRKILARSF